VLGEVVKAALAADPSLETAVPEIEWCPMAWMRDRVTHHYWTIDQGCRARPRSERPQSAIATVPPRRQ
jgi:hypothetical protein